MEVIGMCVNLPGFSSIHILRGMLARLLDEIRDRFGISTSFPLEIPPREMGDLSIPCFTMAREMKKSPAMIAEELARYMKEHAPGEISEAFVIDTRGAYVNLSFKTRYLLGKIMLTILEEGSRYGSGEGDEGLVIFEHTSANPNGPFHVGRARNPIIGDTMVRLLRKLGYEVEVQYWINDMGRQAATLAWGKMNISDENVPPLPDDNPYGTKADHFLVRYYQEAHRRIEETPGLEDEIDAILYDIELGNEETKGTVRHYSEMVLGGMKESLFDINVRYDRFVWESESVENDTVREVIDTLKSSPHAHKEEGARYLELESFGISGRSTKFFFTRSDGTSLYTTRDLAYHLSKLRRATTAINVLGEDHKLQARQLSIALGLLGMEKRPESIFYSFVSLDEGKMSTRKGKVVYLDDLVQEALYRAYVEVSRRRPDLNEEKRREIARIVGIGCIRYNIIRVQADKRIVFRWKDALNFEGDSSPFLQYAHARCCGILQNAKDRGFDTPSRNEVEHIAAGVKDTDLHGNERLLLRILAGFPAMVEEAGASRKPHFVPKYLHELASAFNNFYQSCPVLTEEDGMKRNMRMAIVDCTRIVLAEGLALLGITAPVSM